MARLSHALGVTPAATPERGTAELAQLLSRLEHTILRADQARERRLRSSEFERARINSNLDYARSLLTRLEQETMGLKFQARKAELQTDLTSSGAFGELVDHIPTEGTEDAEASDPEPEIPDLPPSVASQTIQPPGSAEQSTGTTRDPDHASPETLSAPATTTAQTLRARGPQPSSAQDTAATTARAALFANRRTTTGLSTKTGSSTATAEAILDHQRAEQDALSGSILKMASALKASSQRFSTTLEEDKALLSRAGEGMDRTEKGMDAASRRMGALKRMTEGKGWYGRMILYAWVYGLMVALVLLVFVMPKLRF
ncbi:synaptobrevin [Verticillium alfalfae VaMs.102]|uniref:Synaptobrevin n=1 Tax=Verticillium alfalfae (strain VaMs.102 / ATCC MYA-4576 / FGSC 10136) TaxID=526221 RepID=C9SP58_VERA1|nr:synaptobrevin [Verticillium alfalfae VaMs.102]EEY20573.1 synaptobrevin [Verticillium alfalfae VaMs.102]